MSEERSMDGTGRARGIPGRYAIGLAVVVVAALVVAGGAWTFGRDDGGGDGGYYLEARIRIRDFSIDIGTQGEMGGEAVESESLLRFWARDSTHMRMELEWVAPAIQAGERSVWVMDGDSAWFYESAPNTYTRTEIPDDAPDVEVTFIPGISVLLGPVPGGTLDSLLAYLEDLRGDGSTFEVTGSDVVLGRTVQVIEHSPISRSSGSDGEQSHGTGKLWFDPESGMILRNEIDDPAFQSVAEVLDFRKPDDADDDTFTFTPPDGATERENTGSDGGSSTSSELGGDSFDAPVPDFASVTDLPDGWTVVGESREGSGNDASAYTVMLRHVDGGTIEIVQRRRADGLPPELRTVDEFTIDSSARGTTTVKGYVVEDNPDSFVLAWMHGTVAIQATGTGVGLEVMWPIATRMEGPR